MRPEDVPAEIVEIAAERIWDHMALEHEVDWSEELHSEEYRCTAQSAIAAVYPLIAKGERERCARVADSASAAAAIMRQGDVKMADAIAAAIRALEDQP